MAKIQEETFTLRISKLIRSDEEDVRRITDNSFTENVLAVLQELLGPAVIVEIEENE